MDEQILWDAVSEEQSIRRTYRAKYTANDWRRFADDYRRLGQHVLPDHWGIPCPYAANRIRYLFQYGYLIDADVPMERFRYVVVTKAP